MTPAIRRPGNVIAHVGSLVTLVALVASACSVAAPSASPSALPSVVPTPSTSVAPSATPNATSSPGSTPAPTVAPSTAACATLPQTVQMPSDRVTDIEVLGLPGRDVVRFTFGNGSLTPVGPPSGSLESAAPPFTHAASGLPIDLAGDHAAQVVFKGMSIMNDVGQPTFTGERQIKVTDASRSLREVILFDESEGQIGWYIGYDGSSCVSVSREGDAVLVVIDFGPGS